MLTVPSKLCTCKKYGHYCFENSCGEGVITVEQMREIMRKVYYENGVRKPSIDDGWGDYEGTGKSEHPLSGYLLAKVKEGKSYEYSLGREGETAVFSAKYIGDTDEEKWKQIERDFNLYFDYGNSDYMRLTKEEIIEFFKQKTNPK